MKTMARFFSVATALFAASAFACPVCGLPSEQGQGAYVVMTGVMSLLPLAMLGGVVTWVVLRVRKADQQEQGDAPAPAERRG